MICIKIKQGCLYSNAIFMVLKLKPLRIYSVFFKCSKTILESGINANPDKIKTINAFCKPNACARYPIIGGPKNIPTVEYVPIIDMTIAIEYFLDFPARINVIGYNPETPNPIIPNPMRTG